jgi:hypothetical protein
MFGKGGNTKGQRTGSFTISAELNMLERFASNQFSRPVERDYHLFSRTMAITNQAATAKIPSPQIMTIKNATMSKRERRMFGLDLDFWNAVMVTSLAFAAVAAFAVVISTAVVIKLQKAAELATEQEFEQYKLDASVKITGAEERAKVAEQRASEANLEIERLKTPRSISPEQRGRIVNKLKPFSTLPFTFSVMLEPEPLALMEEISEVLKTADWTRVPYHLSNGGMTYGDENTPSFGTIFSLTGLAFGFPSNREVEWKPVVDVLQNALHAESGIEATTGSLSNEVAAKNDSIVIWIGRKP